MSTIGYVRVSTDEQTTENQQQQIAERLILTLHLRTAFVS